MGRWDGKTHEGGSLTAQDFPFFINTLGLKFAYGLLRLVTFYYYLFAVKPRAGARFLSEYPSRVRMANRNRCACAGLFIFSRQTLVDGLRSSV